MKTNAKIEGSVVFKGVIHPWHIDVLGHVNVRWYGHFFDDAALLALSELGLDQKLLQDMYGVHTVTAKASTHFVKELTAGDMIQISASVRRVGNSSISIELSMSNLETQEIHARYEFVEVFFDPKTRQSANIPESVKKSLDKVT